MGDVTAAGAGTGDSAGNGGGVRPAASGAELEALAETLGGLVRRAVPLADRTTYRVGGVAALFVEPADDDELGRVAQAVVGSSVPVLAIGRGSNLLVADAGFGGLVVALGDGWDGIHIDGTTVRAGAAAALPVVARRTAAVGLRGFEWAVGVPGSVGGAIRMNAGGHGSDMAASVTGVRVLNVRTGEDGWMPATHLDFGYRTSAIGPDDLVVAAELALQAGERDEAEATIAGIVAWRRAHQPGGANAGSVFTNPPGDSAGRLIDSCGLKGLRVGSAYIPDKHANFIQVDPDGRAADVVGLMAEVRQKVAAATGVELVAETRLVGFPGTLGGPPSLGPPSGTAGGGS